MKEYDVIAIGSGSSMNIISAMMNRNKDLKVALIDKDEPGGICLTRGCIPSKMLLYPAELRRMAEKGPEMGVNILVRNMDFSKVMKRMRDHIDPTIASIRKGLTNDANIDYYTDVAEFTAPYTLKVGDQTITSKLIFLCIGSELSIPPIEGLDEVGYLTSDTVIKMTSLPSSITIVGGGYIAAEYGHFFSAMGAKVTILGRNPQFIPQEEPEVSWLAKKQMSEHMTIITNLEVLKAEKGGFGSGGKKKLIAKYRKTGKMMEIASDEIIIATGRISNTNLLHPEKAGIEVDQRGWIKVNEYLETNQPGIWAFGDATGKHLFKHVANYESVLVYRNAIQGKKIEVDYHAVPSAVFSYPEIASVGMREKEAIAKYGEKFISIGFQKFEDTAKGEAMGSKDHFVKVIVENKDEKIIGAHIIGPHASILIQEIINLMYVPGQSYYPIYEGMHIHPALNEVVERAFGQMMPVKQYQHMLLHFKGVKHVEPGAHGHAGHGH